MNLAVSNAEGSARRAAARGLRVLIPLGIAESAQKYRRLSKKEASEHGRFDNDRTPYLAGPMAALQEDHPAEVVIFLKPTQIGGTTIGQNWLCWTFIESPASFMVLLPTEKIGLRWVRSKFKPMVRATPALRRLVHFGARRRANSDDESTMQEIHAGMSVVYVASANISSDMRMVSCRRLLLDEVDEFPAELPGEGDPIELAFERFNTYVGRRKCFETSTPTDDESRIAKDYEDSSQGEYFVPCPHCEHMQTLEWANLKYTPSETRDAAYACNGCGALIAEQHKPEMLRRGEWRHQFPDKCASRIGFRLNCLYTPLGLGDKWSDNARKYEKAKKDPAKLRAFTNTRLAEVHRGKSIRIEAAELQKRRFPYRLRTTPVGVLMLTAGVDVQHDRIEVQIIGWGRDERATVIDSVAILGAPTGGEVWEKLDEYLARPLQSERGRVLPIECTLVDSGNWQHEVTNYTRTRRNRKIFASKGSTVTARPPIGRPTMVDVKYRGKVDPRGAEQYQVGVHVLKNTLFARLRADGELIDVRAKEAQPFDMADLMVRFSIELEEDYFEQLTAEKYDAPKRRWVNVRERNEALDTFILAMAAALHHSVGMHRMREIDWTRREELYEPVEGAKPLPAKELGKDPITRAGGFLPTSAKTSDADFDFDPE